MSLRSHMSCIYIHVVRCKPDYSWRLTTPAAGKLLTQLSRPAINAARAIVRKVREPEHELWGGHQQHES